MLQRNRDGRPRVGRRQLDRSDLRRVHAHARTQRHGRVRIRLAVRHQRREMLLRAPRAVELAGVEPLKGRGGHEGGLRHDASELGRRVTTRGWEGRESVDGGRVGAAG